MTFEKKIFPIYTMSFDSLKKIVTAAAIGGAFYTIFDELKKIRYQSRIKKLLSELMEALDKYAEREHIHKVILSLEALENEIKASKNEKMLHLHDDLAKNIVRMAKSNLKE